ncbi:MULTISPECIES: UDP-N-acetylmuramate--L-alanine ligase [unclassified Agrobacterium]|jgi:UDP-N-acetylmuramate--alanine ligase|uniref:UDP-N-acetylmuramate--L-alanine ligase n=1 Tax=unclassified Agrobacterium TaxID=2632611 RepID=UPI00244C8AEB|nr:MULTISPECIES: UDP-N-acetylmuramate--L-alanine ligase [unclassified Agrobacterium]MDH0613854.1 UDP-N-acetylmuramate--L-alanine ligase [Agrobacterium sp. GD03872]MDH0696743.1 UDP-N-acetylmuramate--L-alanine ligase [Agrobacterium sp. GD03871]MDH1060093.1 UDP-N-acetylmuramate--L-alanine ligase [Agrobacterium sp. GD03992]MDH2210006.1 UDP-N-acetylmuramate--L-alanine ligase [Agrobacterium sp. GD03643]MDH2219505.1 UDP-N-acetylmuramate--L-alanine ligase [Agrobacterium sp. GD03638]
MKMPKAIGLVHFIGIGGIGMSGIAEVLHNLGHRVQGSDQADSANVQRLRDKGIEVFVGHTADNIGDAEVVVVSTAIKKNNPELIAAREKHLPIVRRAEMLAELMRFRNAIAIGGTHGKTTTTSMVATLLEAGNLDPTVINGGIINAYGTNARMGEGEWMVVEADESDGTFLKLPADVAVITNIDPEHLDHYGNFDAVRAAFRQFVENVPFYGFGVMCLDHPEVQALVGRIEDRKVITYGENPQADVRFSNVRIDGTRSVFDVEIRRRRTGKIFSFKDLVLPMPGRHNVSNATAAIAVANRLGISEADIKKGLASFGGVKRRFTLTGEANGVQVFDDYGHHPVEIKAVLAAAREACKGRIIAVHQPHRYSRLSSLFDDFAHCFNDADTILLAPVYAAGEDPIEGASSEALVSAIKAAGHRDARFLEKREDLASQVAAIANPGDFVVLLGAGNITQWAAVLPSELKSISGKSE